MLTPRYKVNQIAGHLADLAVETAEIARICSNAVSKVGFDLRNISHEEGIFLLSEMITAVQNTKRLWISVRKDVDNIIFSLDWLLARCNQDKKKCIKRLEEQNGR